MVFHCKYEEGGRSTLTLFPSVVASSRVIVGKPSGVANVPSRFESMLMHCAAAGCGSNRSDSQVDDDGTLPWADLPVRYII